MFDTGEMGQPIQEAELSFTSSTLEPCTLTLVVVHWLDEVQSNNGDTGDVEWFAVPVDGGGGGAIYLLVVYWSR